MGNVTTCGQFGSSGQRSGDLEVGSRKSNAKPGFPVEKPSIVVSFSTYTIHLIHSRKNHF